MAKNKNLFGPAQRNIARFESASRRDRVGDYKVARTANEAVFANLRKTTRGSGKFLTRTSARTLALMEQLVQRQKIAGRKDITSFEKDLTDVDGMLAGRNAQAVRTLAQDTRLGLKGAAAIAGQGAAAARTTDAMLEMAKATNQGLESAADYELASALKGRTEQDAAAAAQMHFELQQTRLQHKLQLQQMEKQVEAQRKELRFQERLAQKTLGEQTFGVMKPAVHALTSAVPDVLELHQQGKTTDEILMALVEKGLLSDTDIQMPQVKQAINSLTRNTQAGPDSLAGEIVAAIRTTPGWESVGQGKKDRLFEWVRSQLKAAQAEYERERRAAELEDDGARLRSYRPAIGF